VTRRPKVDSRYGRWNSCLHYQVHNISRVNPTSYTKVQLLFHHCGMGRDSHPFPSLQRHRSVSAHRVGDPCFRASVCTNMQTTETKTDLCRAIRPAFHSYFVLGWTENGTNNRAIDHKGLMLHSAHNLAVVRSFHNKQTNKKTHTHTHTSHVFRNFVQNINRVLARVTRVYRTLPLLCCEKQIWTWTPKESMDRKNNQQS